MKKILTFALKNIFVIIFITLFISSIVRDLKTESPYPAISQDEAIEKIDVIERVMVSNGEYLIITEDNTYITVPGDEQAFSQILYANGIKSDYVNSIQQTSVLSTFLKTLLILLIFSVVYVIVRFIRRTIRITNSINGIDKNYNDDMQKVDFSTLTGPKMGLNIKREVPNVKFSDLQGCDELKRDAKSLISYLQNPYKYELMGARMPKGVMLYGPPGTGKTLTAKAIAGEAGVPFLSVSGSDFMEMYVGVGAKRVRELFAVANKLAPCIVFIDEIDAVAGKRGATNNGERDQTINSILTEMDGFSGNKGVMVIAATNRLDMLDPAILRPGRFDKHLAVPLPDKKGRLEILKLHAKNKKIDESVDLEIIASQTTGFSGADLENLLNEATLITVERNKKFVTSEEVDRAFFKVIMKGDVKDNQSERGKEELKLVAWHEAGHALITKLLTEDEVTRVTILASTSGAGGVTFHNPPEGQFFSKQDLKNRIAISYGGRAAEEILFGNHDQVTVGASSDIQSASKAIKDYIMKYGMSERFGMLDISAFDYQSMSNEDIVNEAAKLSVEIYEYTLNTLKAHKDKLELIAEELLEKETILDKDINRILGIEDAEESSKPEELSEEIATVSE